MGRTEVIPGDKRRPTESQIRYGWTFRAPSLLGPFRILVLGLSIETSKGSTSQTKFLWCFPNSGVRLGLNETLARHLSATVKMPSQSNRWEARASLALRPNHTGSSHAWCLATRGNPSRQGSNSYAQNSAYSLRGNYDLQIDYQKYSLLCLHHDTANALRECQGWSRLYKSKCAHCHGASGEGKPTMKAPALKATALTSKSANR